MRIERFAVVVIGSGFGGSIMSMVLRRLGRSVLMVEQGKHPRFAIGESSTPFANLLLERIAHEFDLPFLQHFSEWGAWQRNYPQVACGLKRGFSFFHHRFGEQADFSDRSSQLLVAASPNDEVADTHWYRPGFDHFLVQKAEALGINYADGVRIETLSEKAGEWSIVLRQGDTLREIRAEFIIDASGPHSVLAEHYQIPRRPFSTMPRTAGVWAHFRDVKSIEESNGFLRLETPPYPVDDAAVHHLFPGGWIWALRFNNGITSAGTAFTAESRFVGTTAEETWQNLLSEIPSVGDLFAHSSTITPFYGTSDLSFCRALLTGNRWAMLPSAAGFVDPLLSTGFALNLLGVQRLAQLFAKDKSLPGPALKAYEQQTILELETAADLISALYAKMNSPSEFNALTLLYFAALSFTETAWRLDKSELAEGFLLGNNPQFSFDRARLCESAREGRTISRGEVEQAISPFDVAGLTDFSRENWYPVKLADLVENAHKLQATKEELQALFRKLKVPWPGECALAR